MSDLDDDEVGRRLWQLINLNGVSEVYALTLTPSQQDLLKLAMAQFLSLPASQEDIAEGLNPETDVTAHVLNIFEAMSMFQQWVVHVRYWDANYLLTFTFTRPLTKDDWEIAQITYYFDSTVSTLWTREDK